jgi:ABC-type transport system substrate-binding protein
MLSRRSDRRAGSMPGCAAHVRRAAACGAVVAVTVGVAACGSSTGSSSAPAVKKVSLSAQVTAATTPVGLVTWNLPTGEPTSLDPALSALENISTVDGNLCESLFRFGPDYQLIPDLATSVTQSNPTRYVIDLRHGVHFWDGKVMTSADVVYSMDRVNTPAIGSSWIAAYQGVSSIRAHGPYQVIVTFKQPNAEFRWNLATPATTVVQRSYVAQNPKAFGSPTRGVMCTGPFRFSSWKQGQDIVIARNGRYWDHSRIPLAREVRFTFDTDAASQSAALADGSVEGQWDSSVATFKQLRKSRSGSLLYAPSLSTTFISWFVDHASVKSEKIREALHDIIPYESIAKNVYGGSAIPVKSLTPPHTWGYAKGVFTSAYAKLQQPAQNLAAAKKLVSAAGRQSAPVVLGYSATDPEETNIALAIQSAAQEVGLNLKLDALNASQSNQVFSSAKARAPLSGLLATGYLDYPDPLEYDSYWTTGSYYNFGGYHDPRYDKLVAQAQQTVKAAGRASTLVKAEAIYYASDSAAPIVSQYINVFVNHKLTGVTPNQNFYYTAWADKLGSR